MTASAESVGFILEEWSILRVQTAWGTSWSRRWIGKVLSVPARMLLKWFLNLSCVLPVSVGWYQLIVYVSVL